MPGKWIEELSKFDECFIKSYNEESDKGYFLETDALYPKNLHNIHNGLPFFHERIKVEKVEKLVDNLHDKTEYFIHIKNLNQALNNRLVLKKIAYNY